MTTGRVDAILECQSLIEGTLPRLLSPSIGTSRFHPFPNPSDSAAYLKLTAHAISILAADRAIATHHTIRRALLVRLTYQRALVEFLRAWRYVDGRVAVEEVDRLHRYFDDFAGHHWEVFDARNLFGLLVLFSCRLK